MYEIKFYRDYDGNSEVFEYIKKLKNLNNKENKLKFNKIYLYIKMLEKYGLNLSEKYIKKIDKEIWELRPLRDRILFTKFDDNKIVLLSVFIKRTPKTPRKEKEKARRLIENYKKRIK